VALVVAVAGLVVMNFGQIHLGGEAYKGVVGMIVSSFMFALSTVWLKSVGAKIDPLRQSTGVLVLAVPCFWLTWYFFDGEVPQSMDMSSVLGVGYLAIGGSVIGHTLFFYVLRNCSMFVVSLIPLLTPLLSLSIGYLFANEVLGVNALIGSALIIFSLLLYQGVFSKFIALLMDFMWYFKLAPGSASELKRAKYFEARCSLHKLQFFIKRLRQR